MFYNLSNAFARTSGGRYIVPTDWIITIYFLLGVFQVVAWLAGALGGDWKPGTETNEVNERKPASKVFSKTAIILLVLFGFGTLIPLSERLFPPRYEGLKPLQLLAEHQQGLAAGGFEINAIESFLQTPNAEILVGRALYPRFYKMGDGESHLYPWHRDVSLVILVWAAASAGLQQVLKQERWETVAIYLWGAVDVAAVMTLLLLANGAASPLVVIYAVLVAASGLWLRPGVVTFTTATAIVSYLLLVADFFFRRTWLQTVLDSDPDRHVDFLLALVLIVVAVRYQVRRARAPSHFFASRRPPWIRRGD